MTFYILNFQIIKSAQDFVFTETVKKMSSGQSHYEDQQELHEWRKNKQWIKDLSATIAQINPTGPEFRDLQWIVQNKERILGNRRLLELLR